MNIVILLSGPQGAGKSTYAENICQMNPSAQLVSRDALLMEIYGTVYFDPYCGFPMDIYETMYKKIKDLINERKKHYHCVVIVDCWNGSCRDRTHLVGKFKEHGADKIICWKFMTEYSLCKHWYQKEKVINFIPNTISTCTTELQRISKKMVLMEYHIFIHCNSSYHFHFCLYKIKSVRVLLDSFFHIYKMREINTKHYGNSN